MNRVIDILGKCERGYMTLMVCLSILLSTVGVFYRYFLNSSLSFVEEVAGFILAGIIVIGSSIAITEGEHIRVTLISQIFPGARKFFNIIAGLVLMSVSLILFVLTAKFVHRLIITNQTATSIQVLCIGWPLSIMPVGYLLCVIKSAFSVFNEITSIGKTSVSKASRLPTRKGC